LNHCAAFGFDKNQTSCYNHITQNEFEEAAQMSFVAIVEKKSKDKKPDPGSG